jgi:hypothetical protein
MMIWINLITAVLISGYLQWLCFRGWRYHRDLAHAGNAKEVLQNVLAQRRFYLIQGIGSLGALVLFLGGKTLLLLFAPAEPSAFTTFVFGDFASRFLIVKLGCLGAALAAAAAACGYQCLRSRHYLDVLYALRDALGLAPARKIPNAPPLSTPAVSRQVI